MPSHVLEDVLGIPRSVIEMLIPEGGLHLTAGRVAQNGQVRSLDPLYLKTRS
jgi:hypothetical protein